MPSLLVIAYFLVVKEQRNMPNKENVQTRREVHPSVISLSWLKTVIQKINKNFVLNEISLRTVA